ncbi:signal peptidase I [Actinokineospora enzanensis]|uniref:signal peptidase I n=1 Tax=Actinokineospora enzanensis TaxID=155975 RepID=UPI0003820476|nr:signal peptidase I [Actinokineospora enzanensis]
MSDADGVVPGDRRDTEDLDVSESDTKRETPEPGRSAPEPETGPDTGKPDEPRSESAGDDEETPAKPKKKRSLIAELGILLGVALVLTIVIQSFIARVFVIPSESMEKTLHGCAGCNGDHILVDRVVYYFRDPEPGDVVVFKRPDTWDQDGPSTRSDNAALAWLQDFASQFGLADPSDEDLVKRVIAVGGQTIECCDAQQRVMVDGKPLDEPYINHVIPNDHQLLIPKITIPPGMLWVMGDNRGSSADSRLQGGGGVNGFVPVDNVIGKARTIILPPSRWQGIGDHNPQTQSLSAPGWQSGIPAGLGVAAAFPVVWVGRRLRGVLRGRSDRSGR